MEWHPNIIVVNGDNDKINHFYSHAHEIFDKTNDSAFTLGKLIPVDNQYDERECEDIWGATSDVSHIVSGWDNNEFVIAFLSYDKPVSKWVHKAAKAYFDISFDYQMCDVAKDFHFEMHAENGRVTYMRESKFSTNVDKWERYYENADKYLRDSYISYSKFWLPNMIIANGDHKDIEEFYKLTHKYMPYLEDSIFTLRKTVNTVLLPLNYSGNKDLWGTTSDVEDIYTDINRGKKNKRDEIRIMFDVYDGDISKWIIKITKMFPQIDFNYLHCDPNNNLHFEMEASNGDGMES